MHDTKPPDPTQPQPENVYPQRVLLFLVVGVAAVALAAFLSIEFAMGPHQARAYPSRSLPPEPEQTILPAKEPDENYFPCSDCHADEPTNRQVRKLEDDHEDLALTHGNLWCLHCHDADDRDRLHLADGEKIAFEDSWRLCVQCHGHKQAQWRAGVHGKRVGHWWGEREVWVCVSCHDPHEPHFRPIQAMPSPKPPSRIALHAASPGEEDAR